MSLHMRLVTSNDFYSIKVRGYVTPLHLDVLDVLYQPILGFAPTSLYRYLYATRDFRAGDPLSFSLLTQHLGFTYSQISGALSRLEALGLCRTYLIKRNEFSEYIIELLAPKDPSAFSNDQIFIHLLSDTLGPKHTQDLLNLFALDVATTMGDEVTSDFAEIYGSQVKEISGQDLWRGDRLENIVGGVKIPFDEALFFTVLTRKRSILPTAITANELKVLKQIAGLYNLTEEALAEQVGDYYTADKPLGSRIDFTLVQQNLQELIKYPTLIKPLRRRRKIGKATSDKAKLINDMELLSPFDFLISQNEGTKVAPADAKILQLLAIDYNLTPPVINALIYYTLLHNNNELIRALIEKNASLLARNKVTSALDALDTLERPITKKDKTSKAKDAAVSVKPASDDTNDDAIWDELKKI
ncbi:MAG: hypothetical protein WC968_01820 [Bacilli bacterium]